MFKETEKMRKTRIMALVLSLVMLCGALSGCSLFGKTVMKVGDAKISENVFLGAVGNANMTFMQQLGISMADMLDQELAEGQTGADLLKNQAEMFILVFESANALAEDFGVTLSKEDKASIKQSKNSQIESMGGRKAFLDQMAQAGYNEEFYDYLLESQAIQQKVYSTVFMNGGARAPSTESVVSALSDGYFRVKHILVQADKEAEDYDEKKAKAESLLAKAKAGEDFDVLVKENNEDPGMTELGYVIDKDGYTPAKEGPMVAEFTEASVALEVGGVSDIVTTSHGFHIIKRYPLDKEFIEANIATYVDEFAYVAFVEAANAAQQSLKVEYTSAYDKIDLAAFFGVEGGSSAAPSVGGAVEEAPHDHEHEGEAEVEGIETATAVPAE